MNTLRLNTLLILVAVLFGSASLFAKGDTVVEKSFAKKDEVSIKLATGDCEIVKSNDNKIHVKVVHNWDTDVYEVVFKEKSNSITMKEDINNGHNGGDSKWTVKIPDGVEVDFNTGTGDLVLNGIKTEIDGNTGTGDLTISNCNGKFDLNTGTGDIEITKSSGEFDLNSGTGSLNIENSKGEFDGNSGTGDVEAKNITIEDECDFNSGTGDVKLTKPMGSDYEVSLNSGTGDAVLDMDGVEIEGYYEFKAHKRRGDIVSPVAFDQEKEYEQGDEVYLQKSFTKGSSKNRYYLGTGTGEAKLVK